MLHFGRIEFFYVARKATENCVRCSGTVLSTGALQEYDVALKLLLQQSADRTLRELAGVAVRRWLNVELPEVRGTRVDLLGETDLGDLVPHRHIHPVFKRTSTDCASCHGDLHRGQMGKNCEKCHTVSGWLTAVQQTLQHADRFPLLDAHATTQCDSCHKGAATGQFQGLSTDCITCHQADFTKAQLPPHTAAAFSQDCTTCHSMNSWRGAKFDHAAVAHFPLTGVHATLDCQSCHVNGKFAGTPAACVNCHLDAYKGTTNPNHTAANFSTDCSVCHNTSTWAGATLDHSKTKFPLTGGHKPLQCNQCHTGGSFASTPANCDACHMANYKRTTNPNHVKDSFPLDCSLCHDTTSWAGAAFDHSKTKFPLTGAHTALRCAQCHNGGPFSATPTNCDGCYLANFKKTNNPNHVAAGFPLDCSVCHTTATWAGASFDHSKTRFPLTGRA